MSTLWSPKVGSIVLGAAAVSGFAIFMALPKAANNFKPIGENKRMEEGFEVYTDKSSGDIYGWIIGKGGEERFVKMDKNSENKVRKERQNELEKAENAQRENANLDVKEEVKVVSQKRADVRSEQIFEKNSTYKDFDVNARIKYRLRERKMLYRLAISLAPNKDEKCLTKAQEETLISLKTEKGNQVRFRFVDKDDFWLRDNIIPLNENAANNYKTAVIDSYNKDSCGNLNKLVFHGRLSNFSLPDYSWVEDGKLLFNGVKIVETEYLEEEIENSREK
tara:strand:+ start:1762 stop:2595 length:834 start_codon:yes stop_codon:yes gene_type:complete